MRYRQVHQYVEQPLAHLDGQTCHKCGHGHIEHHHRPSCACGCNLDPKCAVCGELTSYHEPLSPPPGDSGSAATVA